MSWSLGLGNRGKTGLMESIEFYLCPLGCGEGSSKMKKWAAWVFILGIWAVLASSFTWAWSKDILI
jgi:hypothetical protein